MAEYPLIQFNPGMKPNDSANVTARFSNEAELRDAVRLANLAAEILAPNIKGLQVAIDQAPAAAIAALQQGGMNPQVIGQQMGVPQGPGAPANAFNPQGHYEVPAQPQQQYNQAPTHQAPPQASTPPAPQQPDQWNSPGPAPQWAQQPSQPASQQQYNQPVAHQQAVQAPAPVGPCPFCDKPPVCSDCSGATNLVSFKARTGKFYNKHECPSHGHKGVMCATPIWKSKQTAAQQQGIALPPGLIYEQ